MRLSLPWSRPKEPLSSAEALAQWDGAYRWSGELGPGGLHFGTAGSLQAPDALLEDLAGLSHGRISRRDALRVTAVLRARNLIAGVPSTMPLELRDRQRNLDEQDWLGVQPNPLIETNVMVAQTFEDLLFEATSYWRITALDTGGFPLEAEHLNHQAVSQAMVTGQGSRIISQDLPFTPEDPVYVDGVLTSLSTVGRTQVGDVIRFTSPNPPLLVHAAHAIRVLLLLDRAAADYASDPLPFGYFKDATDEEPLGDDSINEVLSGWERARKQRRWGYIGSGLELTALDWPSPKDLQLTEARNHAVLEIARATGLDASDLATNIEGSSMTYANAEQRRLDLIDFVLNPYITSVENRFSMGDITPPGLWAHFNASGFTRADLKSRMEAYKIGKEAEVLESNDGRRMEGWPDLPADSGDDAEIAATVARLSQQLYPGTEGKVVMTVEEARQLMNRAGAGLTGSPPEPASVPGQRSSNGNGREPEPSEVS